MIVQNGVALEAVVRLEPTVLKLYYAVRNGSGREIGLLNRIPLLGPDGKASFPVDVIYIDLEGTTIHLKKMILPVPEGLNMAARPVPAQMRLAPGGEHREEVKIPLAVQVYNPLRRAQMVGQAEGKPVVADVLRRGDAAKFTLGFFFIEPNMRLDPTAAPEVYEVYPPPLDKQLLLSEGLQMPAAVAVFDYRVVLPDDTQERVQ